MLGSNLNVDISIESGMKLIVKYWSTIDKFSDFTNEIIAVGDVHGDMHQFLAPLVTTGIIKLKDKIEVINTEKLNLFDSYNSTLYIPSFEIVKNKNIKIVYLGDLVDGNIFTKEILYMYYLLKKEIPENIYYIIGNHECDWLSAYVKIFKENRSILNSSKYILRTFINTFNVLDFPNIQVSDTIILYKGNEQKGIKFLTNYYEFPLKLLYKMFKDKMLQIGYLYENYKNNINLILSHTTFTISALNELDINIFEFGKHNENNFNDIVNKEFIEKINNNFYNKAIKNNDYLNRNKITYVRNLNKPLFSQAIGHTQPDMWKDIDINEGIATTLEERKKKVEGIKYENGNFIYYCDFSTSAIFNDDYISRPDYVIILHDKLLISNLPAFYFENNKEMIVLPTKSKHRNDKKQILLNSICKLKFFNKK